MSAPEDVEALLAEHELVKPHGLELRFTCSAPECEFTTSASFSIPDRAHRAHVAAVLAAYVTEKQREAVEAAAAEIGHMASAWGGDRAWLTTGTHIAALVGEILTDHAAAAYPTPKETP